MLFKTLFRKIVTLSLALQFSSGKVSMIFSGVTAATVLSMKFHIFFPLALAGCFLAVVLVAIVMISSGWMQKEFCRLNQLNGITPTLDKLDAKIKELNS